jgi:hypothetical protein
MLALRLPLRGVGGRNEVGQAHRLRGGRRLPRRVTGREGARRTLIPETARGPSLAAAGTRALNLPKARAKRNPR